jgi:hypothetical protein
MSTMSTSTSPHLVSWIIFVSAPLTMGPRHVAAAPGFIKNPMDWQRTP